MTAFDELKSMSFGGVEFPYTSIKVSGGLRDHVHEYPHSPGGAVEKLGRKLYDVRVTADFLAGSIVKKYGRLWPDSLSTLREFFEKELTEDLHVPILGTFPAYCVTWEEEARNTRRNGVSVELTFREDQDQALLISKMLEVDSAALDVQLGKFQVALEDKSDSSDLFDGILQAANGVLAIKDQIDLYGELVASKITTLALLCDQADRQVNELDTLEFQNVRDALHDLWESATKLQSDIQQKRIQLRTYVTPIEMPIVNVARALGIPNPGDILQLNALDDPLRIPAGTQLRYYPQAA